MKKLTLKLENCYGIKKLEDEFDFSNCKTIAIYAANGVMKTSFAKTFKDIASKSKPCDQMDDSLSPVCNVLLEDGTQLQPENICVIEPYNDKAFNSEEKVLTLLADEETRKDYLSIYKEIDAQKKTTLSVLKKITGSGNYEAEINDSFLYLKKKNIFEIFDSILPDIASSKDLFDFTYNDVFDPKNEVRDFLVDNFQLLQSYIEKYEELVSGSDFFGKNTDSIFGTSEATALNLSLEGDEYFNTGHKLLLKKHGEIQKAEDFSKLLNEEIERIFNDKKLQELFQEIEKKLDKTKTLRTFKKVITQKKYKHILARLVNYDEFKREVWFSFLKQIAPNIDSLVDLYKSKKEDLEMIIQKAKDGQSAWEAAISEFENRFANVPFKISINNKADAVLNNQTPAIDFSFQGKPVERKTMVDNILSRGEKRAFYLLNVIFEIKSRQIQNKETVFIIDDIADSFDYKNKYAIVQYLNDLNKDKNFYSIILTHNFDFYRTITSRLGITRDCKKHAIRTPDGISLIKEVYQKPPFITWMNCLKSGQYYDKNFTADDAKKHILALIPFIRNLIEYGRGSISSTAHGDDFGTLTSLLHSKPNTNSILFSDLKLIFKEHLDKDDFDSSITDTDIVYNHLISTATSVQDNEFNLENKIILAIAIRHKAEEYMWSKISKKDPIEGNQTRELFERYKDDSVNDANLKDAVVTLERVNIMTPENIHLNSFMYEPILDMGIDELKKLHTDVSRL